METKIRRTNHSFNACEEHSLCPQHKTMDPECGDSGHISPYDYEVCGECGFDHEYEPDAAYKAHEELMKDLAERIVDVYVNEHGDRVITTEEIYELLIQNKEISEHIAREVADDVGPLLG
jgi:hypothetical protein